MVVVLPRRIAERLSREAERLGALPEELVFEALSRDLDPRDRAREYIEAAEELLREARKELSGGGVRQAAEKLWCATAPAVKAYAYWREGKRLASHGELWEYEGVLKKELGGWVHDAWMSAGRNAYMLLRGLV